jgi:hypothetical protein
MPLEIRELIIRVTVNEKKTAHPETAIDEKIEEMKKKVIKECMEKISLKLEGMNER